MTGSGKSQFARRLLEVTPRALVIDQQAEYGDCGGVFTDYERSARFYLENLHKNFHIIFQGMDSDSIMAWLDTVYRVQMENKDAPPIGVFLDESSTLSDSHQIGPILANLYTRGRHARISVATLTQRITQINPIIRDQSHVWVSFRLRTFPTDVRQHFSPEDLDMLPNLETLTPGVRPEYGKHYLTDAGDMDVLAQWKATVAG